MADEQSVNGERVRVVMTGAGGAGTIEVIRSLQQSGRYHVAVADAGPHSFGFELADAGYVVPFGADERFESVFAELLRRERPDFVIPLVDEEIPKVHALVAAEFSEQMRVVAPRAEFCALSLDKWRMAERMAELGLATARSALASEVPEDFPFPAIVKPRSGRGSRGVEVVSDRSQLGAYLRRSGKPSTHFMVQEQHFGREFTTSVVVGLSGDLLAVVPKEAVDKRGITVVGITRRVPVIDALCRQMHERLNPRGPFNVQLMLDAHGKPHVFEVNPRYSTTVALTLAAGIDEVDLVMRHARGESIEPPSFVEDFMMLRYSTQLYLPEAEWARRFDDCRGR